MGGLNGREKKWTMIDRAKKRRFESSIASEGTGIGLPWYKYAHSTIITPKREKINLSATDGDYLYVFILCNLFMKQTPSGLYAVHTTWEATKGS